MIFLIAVCSDCDSGPDLERIAFGEELALKTLAPGKYDLKVTVTDGQVRAKSLTLL